MRSKKYSFKSIVWKYKGPNGWHFVTLPKALARKIRQNHSISEEDWGRLPATACIGETKWKTAIWYDTKAKSYLLAIKSAVRKNEDINAGTRIRVTIEIEILKYSGPLPFGL